MSFQQTQYEDVDPGGYSTGILWRGKGDHSGKYAWKNSLPWVDTSYDNLWVVCDYIGLKLKVAYGTGTASFWSSPGLLHNGKLYWQSGSWYLWYEAGWHISQALGACVRESWETDVDPSQITVTPTATSGTYEHTVSYKWDLDYVEITGSPTLSPAREFVADDEANDPEGSGVWKIHWDGATQDDDSNWETFVLKLYDYYYVGNSWWSCSTLEGRYMPRGSGRGTGSGLYGYGASAETFQDAIWEFTGFIYDDTHVYSTAETTPPAGVYKPLTRTATIDDGASLTEWSITEDIQEPAGDLSYIGVPIWVNQADATDEYPRSVEQDDNLKWEYGDITWNTTINEWVLGRCGSSDWYIGSEPDRASPVDFTAMIWDVKEDAVVTDTAPRSCETDASGNYTYGNIHYDTDETKWLIGSVGDPEETGWYEGDEPGNSDVTFEPKGVYVDEGRSNLVVSRQDDITVEFSRLDLGDEDADAYVFETGLWLSGTL